jgi:regulator of protease activity HflC (stomatin/prohibitin superfamily)
VGYGRGPGPGAAVAGVITAIIVVIVGIVTVVSWLGGYVKTDAGHIAVIRNGGPFDNNKIRQIIDPASSRTWAGFHSKEHDYPAQQRFYTISANSSEGERSGVDVVKVPSQDGVDLGIEGTIYFTLNLDHDALTQFDNKFGTRTFRGQDDSVKHAWDGDQGWADFLDAIVRPIIDNDLREQIGSFRCAELVSSCALVQNTSGLTAEQIAKLGSNNGANIAAVQKSVNASLTEDLSQTLGGEFFTNVTFRLSRATLPDNVQSAVNDAQAAFAGITQAQAKVAQAKAEAAANEQRQHGYQQCPACAAIDELKAIPSNVTTFAPGAGFAITPGK